MFPRLTSPGLQRGARVVSLQSPILRLARTNLNAISPGRKALNPGNREGITIVSVNCSLAGVSSRTCALFVYSLMCRLDTVVVAGQSQCVL